MLEHLFGSKTRLKLIRLFFRHPDTPFFVRELTRLIDIQINAIRRELETLLKTGLIKEMEPNEQSGSEAGAGLRRYYILDTASLLYPEIKALILKDQILGQQNFIEEIKKRGGKIKLFLLTGQFTGDRVSPSDLLIVGDLKEKNIARLIIDYEREFGSEIRYTTMSDKEFFDRRRVMDKFLYAMFEAENIKVVNEYSV